MSDLSYVCDSIFRNACTSGAADAIVTFHVIIPISKWDWDEHSCIHIELDDTTLAMKAQGLGDFDVMYVHLSVAIHSTCDR